MSARGHRKIVGASGSGKTNYFLYRLLMLLERGDVGVAAFFPLRKAGEEALLHLEDRGFMDRVVVHDIRNVRSVLPKRLIGVSRKADPNERDAENEEFRDAFLEGTIRRRKDIEEIEERPMIEKYGKQGIDVYQNLDDWLPPFEIPNILVKDSDVQLWALDHCTHPRIRAELKRTRDLNGHEQTSHVMPAERHLAGFLNNAQMRAACSVPPTFSVPDHLKRCKTGEPGAYLSLGGSDKATSLHMANDLSQIAIDARQNPSDVMRVTLTDETTNFGLYGASDARNQATLRGVNVGQEFATQSYDFPSPIILRGYRQNSDSVILRCDDLEQATECAKDLARGLDEYHVHHRTSVTKQRTKHNRERRVTKGSWFGEGSFGMSESESEVLVPETEEFQEEQDQYQPGNEQLFWLAQQIMNLDIGEAFFQIGSQKPVKRRIPYVRPLYDDQQEFAEEAQRCLETIQSGDDYQPPRPFQMPEQPKPEKRQPRQAPPKGKAADRARRNANPGSSNSSKPTPRRPDNS